MLASDRSEFCFCGDRHGGSCPVHPGTCPPFCEDTGKFLGRSDTEHPLYPDSAIYNSCVDSRLTGQVQKFSSYATARFVQPTTDTSGAAVAEQVIALGPAASQIAIKQLGTNGGGFFNVNSAHRYENPTPLSNFLEMLAILLIAAALCYHIRRDGR